MRAPDPARARYSLATGDPAHELVSLECPDDVGALLDADQRGRRPRDGRVEVVAVLVQLELRGEFRHGFTPYQGTPRFELSPSSLT